MTTDDFYFSYLDNEHDTITLSTMNDFNVYVKYMLTTKTLEFDLVLRKQHRHQDCVSEHQQQQVKKSIIQPNDEEKVPQFDIICNECCRSIKKYGLKR